jgi:hypothetical protein
MGQETTVKQAWLIESDMQNKTVIKRKMKLKILIFILI